MLGIEKICKVNKPKNNHVKMELASEQIRGNLNPARGTWIHFCNLQVG